jgi:hypothetical protein
MRCSVAARLSAWPPLQTGVEIALKPSTGIRCHRACKLLAINACRLEGESGAHGVTRPTR